MSEFVVVSRRQKKTQAPEINMIYWHAIQVLIKCEPFYCISHSSLEKGNQQDAYKLKVALFNWLIQNGLGSPTVSVSQWSCQESGCCPAQKARCHAKGL